jgi:hypothetical protein
MYAHPYLMQLIAEEHTREMRSAAATARLAREARRARRSRSAAGAAAVQGSARHVLRAIPQPGHAQDGISHRAA